MTSRLTASLVVFGTLMLGGCQTPIVDQTGPLSIRSVTVTALPTVKSVTDIPPALQIAATERLVGGEGTPASVSVVVKRVTYKDPVLSLLVGSANLLDTTVTIKSESGAVLSTFPETAVLDVAVNGLVGAAIAIGQNKSSVDEELVATYAQNLKRHIFGPAGYKPKKAAPASVAKVPAPDAAAPAVPAPTKRPAKKEVPVS